MADGVFKGGGHSKQLSLIKFCDTDENSGHYIIVSSRTPTAGTLHACANSIEQYSYIVEISDYTVQKL